MNSPTTTNQKSEIEKRDETSCSCSTCKSMCKQSPCFPSPAEVTKLIEAGYRDKLRASAYIDTIKLDIRYVNAPLFLSASGCVFQDENGMCGLHDNGLKPIEGRLASHDRSDNGLRSAVCDLWDSREGIDVMKEFDWEYAIVLQRKYLFS